MPEIRERWGTGERLVLRVAGHADLSVLDGHAAVRSVVREHDTVVITLAPGTLVGDLLALCARSFQIASVHTEQPSLHDVYIATVGSSTTEPVEGT